MFDAHVPSKYKEFAPKVVEEDGKHQWTYFGKPGRDLGLNAVAGKPREMYNVNALRYDEMRPGCYDVDERSPRYERRRAAGRPQLPDFTGFSRARFSTRCPDRDINLVMIKAYNDWHVDQWCGAYPERFIPCGILPLFDPEESAREVRRLAEKGCHAVTFSENPEALAMPSIFSDHWDPLFRAASDAGTVLCSPRRIVIEVRTGRDDRRPGRREK